MSVSSVGSSNPYSYLQRFFSRTTPIRAMPRRRPIRFRRCFRPPPAAAIPAIRCSRPRRQDDGFRFVVVRRSAVQPRRDEGAAVGAGRSRQFAAHRSLQSLFGKFDTDGDGQISQSEFEKAIGPDADKAKVDALFTKIDGNGDGAVSQDEMQSAMQKAHGGGITTIMQAPAVGLAGQRSAAGAAVGRVGRWHHQPIRHQCGWLVDHDHHLRRRHQGRDDDAGGGQQRATAAALPIRRRRTSPIC